MVKTIDKSYKRTKYHLIIMGRAYSPHSHSSARYKDKVRGEASKVINKAIEGNLSIRTDYFYTDSKNRLDGDNLLKIICDGLKSVAYYDDSQVTEHHAYIYNLNRSFTIQEAPFPEIFDYLGRGDFVAVTVSSI